MLTTNRGGMRLPFISGLAVLVLAASVAGAQVTNRNTSRKVGFDNECAIAKNPSNALQLFAACNTSSAGLFAARSTDGGVTWTFPDPADRTIADGDVGQGTRACCDPTLAWDTFGNLFLTYIDNTLGNIVTLLSTDSGANFNVLATFGPANVDQPTIVASNTSAAGAPVAVWVVWNQGGQMVARGAAVTGLGTVGAFNALQAIPGTGGCSFGDVAIAPSGAVVQACGAPTNGQGPSTIRVNTDADGLGPNNFGASVAAATTNVGGFDFIPAQNSRSVDPESGLAFDSFATSPHFGRLYLVYTEETVAENNDTDILVRFSDDNGANWSAPVRVNDDPAAPIRSQFLPRISVNAANGDVGVCWYDARASATNTAVEVFCSRAKAAPATPTFAANSRISASPTTSTGVGVEFGDYAGLAYVLGVAHPIWSDASNSTADNPDGATNFDAYTGAFEEKLTLSPCLRRPCGITNMRPGIVLLYCTITPCTIRDPIDRNCTMKFSCPGCPPGGLCAPWYTFDVGYVDPAWNVELFDPRGERVNYQVRRTRTGMQYSFRPSKEFFTNGKLGSYSFVFRTESRAMAGKTQEVSMSVAAGPKPFSSAYGLSRSPAVR